MCYEVQNFLLWNGGEKRSEKTTTFPLPRRGENKSFLTLPREESPTTYRKNWNNRVVCCVVRVAPSGKVRCFFSFFIISLRGAEPLFCCVFLPFSKVGNSQRHSTRLGSTRFNYSSFYGSPSLVGELDNCAIKLRQKHFTKVLERGRSGDRTVLE